MDEVIRDVLCSVTTGSHMAQHGGRLLHNVSGPTDHEKSLCLLGEADNRTRGRSPCGSVKGLRKLQGLN